MSKLISGMYPPLHGTSPTPNLEALSKRELEVLYWLASGASNREISQQLFITETTVKRHVYNIFSKLNVRNRTQAAVRAIQLAAP